MCFFQIGVKLRDEIYSATYIMTYIFLNLMNVQHLVVLSYKNKLQYHSFKLSDSDRISLRRLLAPLKYVPTKVVTIDVEAGPLSI